LSRTTGDGVIRARRADSAAICTRSVSSGFAAVAWQAAMAACTWYGPGARSRRAASQQPGALLDHLLIPPVAVLLLQGDRLAVRGHPRGPARVLQQHQCGQAQHLGLVGQQRGQRAGQPDRLRARVAAHDVRTGPPPRR
jgi:hypothetical protein